MTEEKIAEIFEEVVDSFEEKYVEMMKDKLSQYTEHLEKSLSPMDDYIKELDRLLPVFKQNIDAYVKKQEQRKGLAKFQRNMVRSIKASFGPILHQVEGMNRELAMRKRAVQNAG